MIRTRRNIFLRIISAIVLFFLILMLLLSIPSVQTFLGRYATNQINATYGTAINVEKVGIQFNGDLELKNILIKDHHNDTLIAADELNSSLLDFAKIKTNALVFDDIDLYNLRFNIKTYKGEKNEGRSCNQPRNTFSLKQIDIANVVGAKNNDEQQTPDLNAAQSNDEPRRPFHSAYCDD